jgi:excisionase family DNA binding protein
MTQELVNITTSEVATLARVDVSTVRRWVEKGTLAPSMKLPGGQYRFNRDDVLDLLTPQTTPSSNAADPHLPASGEGAFFGGDAA